MLKTESSDTINNIDIDYVFRPSKQDRQHLLVVFSAVSTDYNFMGTTSEGCRSNILWIKDHFYGESTYYLCHNKNYNIEPVVIELINRTLESLFLTKEQCTLMGFSKGGTAAIFYGLKYDFKNIIASCPQIKIGSYTARDWPKVATHMMGQNYSQSDIYELDAIIPSLLSEDNKENRNIYILSSPDDAQFNVEIEPFLHIFKKYDNFNFIFTESKLAWQHNKLTRYNLPIILSIVYAHGEGIFPKLGMVTNGAAKIDEELKIKHLSNESDVTSAFSEVKKISISKSNIFPEGNSILRWHECNQANEHLHTLIFEGVSDSYSFPMLTKINKDLSYDYYDKFFCDYSAGQFSSLTKNGVDVSTLNNGTYVIKVQSQKKNCKHYLSAAKSNNINISDVHLNKIYTVYSKNDKTYLSIADVENIEPSSLFEIKKSWFKGTLIHYEGVYAIKGISQKEWPDADYFLVAKSANKTFTFRLGRGHRDYINGVFEKHHGEYQKSYFATIQHQGINLDSIPDDSYDLTIVLNKSGALFESIRFDTIVKNKDIIQSTSFGF
ncbi:MAG: hypothetical protein SOI28_03290 [Rahnella inusitata]|jgi:hypothetical protein